MRGREVTEKRAEEASAGMEVSGHKKTGRRRSDACPIIQRSKVELQSELNVSFSLSGRDLAESRTQQHVRRIQNRMVEQVDELRSELESLVFTDGEFLVHTQIHLGQRGSADRTVVAVAEGIQAQAR